MAISKTKKVKKVLVNGTEVPIDTPKVQEIKTVTITSTQEILPDPGFDAIAKLVASSGIKIARGTITPGPAATEMTVSGLDFKPTTVIFCGGSTGVVHGYASGAWYGTAYYAPMAEDIRAATGNVVRITDDGFISGAFNTKTSSSSSFPCYYANTYNWIAIAQ